MSRRAVGAVAVFVVSVEPDGHRVSDYHARLTNRGLEVSVTAAPEQAHTLVVTRR